MSSSPVFTFFKTSLGKLTGKWSSTSIHNAWSERKKLNCWVYSEQEGKNQRGVMLQTGKVGDGNKLKVEEEFEDSQGER